MPKENKKRGRRAEKKEEKEKKRKLEAARTEEKSSKRQKQDNGNLEFDNDANYVALDEEAEEAEFITGPGEKPFFGLLDDEEQEYFRKAAELLDFDHFSGPEERDAFIVRLYHEAEGKELKLANSQSCSRLLERVIQLSTPAQLKKLFQSFCGNFAALVQHRFASHCCESLFTQAAPVVTQEILSPPPPTTSHEAEALPKMEQLFLDAANELQPHLGWHMTDTFASHPLRVLLLVLSGQPIAQSAGKSGLHSRRKENIAIESVDAHQNPTLSEERTVPSSFSEALENLIYTSVAGLDTNNLRSLASHKTGNPILQLLLRLESTQFGKQRAKDKTSIMHLLVPDNPITSESPCASFINGLLYDTIGSRLLETIIECAPSKTYKAIYRSFIKDRLAPIARNDVATYVASKAFIRLSKDDLEEAIGILAPEIPSLVEKNRLVIIRTLIDRSVVRDADTTPLADQLAAAYTGPNGFDITRLLKLSDSAVPTEAKKDTSNDKLHASLLGQSMLSSPGPLSNLVLNSISSLPSSLLLTIATDTHASRTLSAGLTNRHSPTIPRRKLISALYGHIGTTALHPAGSFVVDAVWPGTAGLAFMRERVAEELAENESALRDSVCGRKVWRNWRMDLYKRRRRDWVEQSRDGADSGGFVGFPDEKENEHGKAKGSDSAKKHLTALERARERHAKQRQRREERASGAGARASPVASPMAA